MTKGYLQKKGGKYYAMMSWYDGSGDRHFQSVGLQISTDRNARKAEKALADLEKVFDPRNVEKTNAALIAMGLKPVKAKAGENGYLAASDDHSEYGMTPHMLFGDYVKWWASEMRPSIALSTYSGYYYQSNRMIAPWFNGKGIRLESITAEDIQAFYREEGQHVSPSTIRHLHALIRKSIDHAFRKRDIVKSNPCWKVTLPKMERFIGDYYNIDETQKLLQEVKGTKLEFAIIMAAHYGLRREEIVGLKWSAIDFQYKTLTVRHTVTEYVIDGKPQLIARDAAKTSSSVRTLPLFPSVEDFLLKMKEREDWEKVLRGEIPPRGGRVHLRQRGRNAHAPELHQPLLPDVPEEEWAPEDPLPRPPAHLRDLIATRGRPDGGHPEVARAFGNLDH
jgi:integrase